MGVSDDHHFAWHRQIAPAIRGGFIGRDVLALAERRKPAFLAALGVPDEYIRRADIEGDGTDALKLDINDLSAIPDQSFDGVTLFRASYFIEDKDRLLSSVARVLRPGGTFFADWLHGYSVRPILGFDGGGSTYDGIKRPFRCTYLDQQFLQRFPKRFQALIGHINRPPGDTMAGLVTRWLRPPVDRITLETYAAELASRMTARGFEIVTEDDMRRHGFHVAHRTARYFYPAVGEFNLYIFTAAARRP